MAIIFGLEAAIVIAPPPVSTVDCVAAGVVPASAPMWASTIPVTFAVASAPSKPRRPAMWTLFVVASAVSSAPSAVIESDPASSVPGPTNARVLPPASAVGIITVAVTAPPPVPSAFASAWMWETAPIVTAPLTCSVDPAGFGVAPGGAPT